MEPTFQTLEFDKIKKILKEYTYTEGARQKVEELGPYLSETELHKALRETTQAREIVDKYGLPPLTGMADLKGLLVTAMQGGCLMPEQLEYVEGCLTGVSRLKGFLLRCKSLEQGLPYYEEELDSLDPLRDEIAEKIRGSRVDDFASPLLKSLRQEIERTQQKVRERADGILRSNKSCCSDQFVTMKSGHICLPVKKECRAKIKGAVIDKSATGQTFFIEPEAVAQMNASLFTLRLEEENEERRILYTLSDQICDQEEVFQNNIRVTEKLDFIFAKGRLSLEMEGTNPEITLEREIEIAGGRHPFLKKEDCVPLDFRIGGEVRGIVITGPNTGGKTVAIKTVGLLSIMAQSGLHVPCEKGKFSMNNQVLCDIGDGQNITENLSTFSAHITNVLDILGRADQETLVIMDELGSGTDPAEGMGIAVAILEELKKCGCLYLVTTHYPEVKTYGERTEHVTNARMAFDKETLQPLYRLEIGASGESCAFYIARHLGMPEEMLKTASAAAYGAGEKEKDIPEFPEDISGGTGIAKKKRQGPRIQRQRANTKKNLAELYQIGDSVMVYPQKKIGIVCRKADDKGMVKVQLPEGKIETNHKRLKLHVRAEELYPEDYDFSIIFETVENRKARHQMERKYSPKMEIKTEIKGETFSG